MIIYWDSLLCSSDVREKYRETINKLLRGGGRGGLRIHKLKGSHGFTLYSIYINDTARMICTPYGHQLCVVEILENHEYSKSKFLNRKGLKFSPEMLENIEGGAIEELPFFNKEASSRLEESKAEVAETEYEERFLDFYQDKYIELSDHQKAALSLCLPVALVGNAGTGKTCIGFKILQKWLAEGGKAEILYVSRTRQLVGKMKSLWEELGIDPSGQVRFLSTDELMKEVYSDKALETEVDFRKWYKQFYSSSKSGKRTRLSVDQVISELRIRSGYGTNEEYEELGSKESHAGAETREFIAKVYDDYRGHLGKDKFSLFLPPEIIERKAPKAFGGAGRDDSASGSNVLIFLDEGQDEPHGILRWINQYSQGRFVVSVGQNQRLFDSVSLVSYLKDKLFSKGQLQIHPLSVGYRCPPAVRAFANHVLNLKITLLGGLLDKFEEPKIEGDSSLASKKVKMEWRETRVFSEEDLEKLDANTAIITVESRVKALREETKHPLVFTVESSKGLEFEQVFFDGLLEANENLPELSKQCVGISQKEIERFGEVAAAHLPKKSKAAFHHSWSPFFDRLITGITRSTGNLIIFQNRDHKKGALFDLLKSKDLFSPDAKGGEAEEKAVDNSPEAWEAVALKLLQEGSAEHFERVREIVTGKLGKPEGYVDILQAKSGHPEALQKRVMEKMTQWDQSLTEKKTLPVRQSPMERLSHKAREQGLKIKDVEGDGNCFFHAMVDQLRIHEVKLPDYFNITRPLTHENLRAFLADYLITRIVQKEILSELISPGDIDGYINQITTNRHWAEGKIIEIAAQALRVNLVLINSQTGVANTAIRFGEKTLYLGYIEGVHFTSTEPMPVVQEASVAVMGAESAAACVDEGKSPAKKGKKKNKKKTSVSPSSEPQKPLEKEKTEENERIKKLLEGLSRQNKEGQTSLHISARCKLETFREYFELAVKDKGLEKALVKALLAVDKMGETFVYFLADKAPEAFKFLMEWSKDHEEIREALAASLAICISDQWTSVHLAARHAPEGFKLLVEWAQTDEKIREALAGSLAILNSGQWTLVHLAVRYAPEGFKLLVEWAQKDEEISKALAGSLAILNSDQLTPVHLAARYAQEGFKLLVEWAQTDEEISKALAGSLAILASGQWTPVHIAAQYAPEGFKLLVEWAQTDEEISKALAGSFAIVNLGQWTLVHLAVRYAPEGFKLLVEWAQKDEKIREALAGSLAIPNSYQSTPVHLAAQYAPEGFKLLVEWAQKDEEISKALARSLAILNSDQWTPVHLAVRHAPECFKLLVEWAQKDEKIREALAGSLAILNSDQWTPVHLAAQYAPEGFKLLVGWAQKDEEISKALAGSLAIPNSYQWNPVHLAAQCAPEGFKLLVEWAQKDEKIREALAGSLAILNSYQSTPVHIAAQYAPEGFKLLVEWAKEDKAIREHIVCALSRQAPCGWNIIHLISYYCPQLLREFFNLVQENGLMTQELTKALMTDTYEISGNPAAKTPLEFIIERAPDDFMRAFVMIIDFSPDNLLEMKSQQATIGKTLGLTNPEGKNALQLLCEKEPQYLPRILDLAAQDTEVFQGLLGSLVADGLHWLSKQPEFLSGLLALAKTRLLLVSRIADLLTVRDSWGDTGLMALLKQDVDLKLFRQLIELIQENPEVASSALGQALQMKNAAGVQPSDLLRERQGNWALLLNQQAVAFRGIRLAEGEAADAAGSMPE